MADFTADTRGIGQLARGPEMEAMLHRAAQPGVAAFRAAAPKDSGEFAASVSVDRGGSRDRASVDVAFTAPYASQLIFGGRHKASAKAENAVQQCINAIERG